MVGGNCSLSSPYNSCQVEYEALAIFMPPLLSEMQISGEASGRENTLQLPGEPYIYFRCQVIICLSYSCHGVLLSAQTDPSMGGKKKKSSFLENS